jgi:hypothetical protein
MGNAPQVYQEHRGVERQISPGGSDRVTAHVMLSEPLLVVALVAAILEVLGVPYVSQHLGVRDLLERAQQETR